MSFFFLFNIEHLSLHETSEDRVYRYIEHLLLEKIKCLHNFHIIVQLSSKNYAMFPSC